MNKNEMAAVMLSDGPWQSKLRRHDEDGWKDITGEPLWNWYSFTYRVKPKPAEVFVNEYPDGSWSVYLRKEQAQTFFMNGKSGSPAVRYVRASDVGIS